MKIELVKAVHRQIMQAIRIPFGYWRYPGNGIDLYHAPLFGARRSPPAFAARRVSDIPAAVNPSGRRCRGGVKAALAGGSRGSEVY